MSKSKNNGIDPQVIIDQHGADTVRVFMMFAAPPEQSLEWSDTGVDGANKFLRRLWKLVFQHQASGGAVLGSAQLSAAQLDEDQRALRRKTHETIQKACDDYERRYTFNTVIAAIMELCNAISRYEVKSDLCRSVVHEALESVVLILSPIAPHICHTLWQALGHTDAVVNASWPSVDEQALVRSMLELVVQVNGKVRGKIDVAADADEQSIRELALANPNVEKFTQDKTIKKIIVVPGKLVSIVVG